MPSFGITPESLRQGLKRNDSKNPLKTCHGITTSGRPCRRPLAEAVDKLNSANDDESSIVAVFQENEVGSEITAFFCWQHKDQAASYHVGRARVMELKTRGSLEDMLSNMGLQDAKQVRQALSTKPKPKQRKDRRQSGPLREPQQTVADPVNNPPIIRNDRPYDSDSDLRQYNEHTRKDYARRDYEPRRRKSRHEPSFWDLLCGCFNENKAVLRYEPPARPHQKASAQAKPSTAGGRVAQPQMAQRHSASYGRHDSKVNTPATSPASAKSARRSSAPKVYHGLATPTRKPVQDGTNNFLQVPDQRPPLRETHSQPAVTRQPVTERPTGRTQRWVSAENPITTRPAAIPASPMGQAMSIIPPNASYKLASDLMAEMSKIEQDPREGYIYIYWLASPHASLSDNAGDTLLSESPRRGSHSPLSNPGSGDSLLLKIGRTDNVHRRMTQWETQCGYKPFLVRSYPRPEEGLKVKHVHRVERLIHLELGEKNVKWNCGQCGKEHREWFEVKGREGVREVDRVVGKWIEWGRR